MGKFHDSYDKFMEAIGLTWGGGIDKTRTATQTPGGFRGYYWKKMSSAYSDDVGKYHGMGTYNKDERQLKGQRIAYFDKIKFNIVDYGREGGYADAWGPNEDGKFVSKNNASTDKPQNRLPKAVTGVDQIMAVAYPSKYLDAAIEKYGERKYGERFLLGIRNAIKNIEVGMPGEDYDAALEKVEEQLGLGGEEVEEMEDMDDNVGEEMDVQEFEEKSECKEGKCDCKEGKCTCEKAKKMYDKIQEMRKLRKKGKDEKKEEEVKEKKEDKKDKKDK